MTTPTKPAIVPETETETEQGAFCRTDEPLKVLPLREEFKVNIRWQHLPPAYTHLLDLDAQELARRIRDARQSLGTRAVILGHHYQREDVIQFADYKGDSFKLSQYAASRPESELIVFCGVHFMAETADILSAPRQKVILPNLAAGCSMADMAPTQDAYDCWDELTSALGKGSVVPVTYMNSTAAIKALTGRHGGIVCTSSNAPATLRWAFQQGERILFLPDQHLGRNTGLKVGIALEEMVLWDPFKPLGGNTAEKLRRAKLILWKGHCSVHTRFTVAQVKQARQRYPGIKVIVHPECVMEVVQAADLDGSTEVIASTIGKAPPGSQWAVGTEVNLVSRLARENPDKVVFCLDPVICPCSTMYRVHPAYLLWVLEGLLAGQVANQIKVPEATARWARVALERMLQVV